MAETATLTRPAKAARPVVAFYVSDDESAEIVFHSHGLAARRIGANELGTDFESVECRRLPWADPFAAQGWVPARECVASGWHFDECCGCGARIDEDTQEERGLTVDRVHGWHGGLVYCCAECAADDQRQREDREEFGATVLQRLREKVRQRFGDVEFVTGPWRETAYVTSDFTVEDAAVSFNFPGQKYGPATLRWWNGDMWRQRTRFCGRSRDPYGPAVPEYSVCNGDREAFEAWTSQLFAPSSTTAKQGDGMLRASGSDCHGRG